MKNIGPKGNLIVIGIMVLILCITSVAVLFWSQKMDPAALAYVFGILASIPLVAGPIIMYRRCRKADIGLWKNVSDRGVMIFVSSLMAIFLAMTAIAYFKMSFSSYIFWVILFGAVYFVFVPLLTRYAQRFIVQKA